MNKSILDLYSDYLICSYTQTPATRLSNLMQGAISHDKITRFLSETIPRSQDLWHLVKVHVRTIESPEGIIAVDDSIEEKPYTDENDIVCWHYDHAQGRQVKGINFMTALYHSPIHGGVSLPVGFQIIAKTEHYVDPETKEQRRRSSISKNTYYQSLLKVCVKNNIPFRYVLNDVWYASAENMMFVKHTLKKHFVMPLKSNRKVALSTMDKRQGKYQSVDTVAMKENATREIYLEGVDFPLLLVKQVFENEDGRNGVLYLVTSHMTLTYDQITTLYRTRWHVEEYHKSLKQNASLEKSPTRTVATQTTHFFAVLCSYIKLEMLKVSTKKNHTALKLSIYMQALLTAYEQLRSMKPITFSNNPVFA
jgi:hypothetical protein